MVGATASAPTPTPAPAVPPPPAAAARAQPGPYHRPTSNKLKQRAVSTPNRPRSSSVNSPYQSGSESWDDDFVLQPLSPASPGQAQHRKPNLFALLRPSPPIQAAPGAPQPQQTTRQKLFGRSSSKPSRPPVTAKTQAAARIKRPLSLSKLFSRSSTSLVDNQQQQQQQQQQQVQPSQSDSLNIPPDILAKQDRVKRSIQLLWMGNTLTQDQVAFIKESLRDQRDFDDILAGLE